MLRLIIILLMAFLTQQDYTVLRKRMVEEQIKRRGISNQAVLDAMLTVPRHLFVPEEYRSMAYDDHPIEIGEGQTISQPYIVAYMTEKLRLKPSDKVLEIGTGSGYQAAILAYICDSVFSVEIIPELALMAKENLQKADVTNVKIKCGDGFYGWQEHAPFDAIIVTAAPDIVPKPLFDQLAEGGRLIAPVGEGHYTQYLKLYTRKNGKIISKTLLPVRFVPFTRDSEE